MRRARVTQPIAAIPAGIRASLNNARRVAVVLLPRQDRGVAVTNTRGGRALVLDLLTGEQREIERKDARALLADLGAAIDQAEIAPPTLRGRWAAQAGLDRGRDLRIVLRRRVGYVDVEVEYSGGRWTVKPPGRRPAWFSQAEDWPTEPRQVRGLREALELALEQARAGIKLACTRRDTQRREAPAEVKKTRAKRSRKVGGVQAGLFAA